MSKSAKILLIVSGLFTLAIGLSNIFVNIYLWKNSNNFLVVAIYNLAHYIFIPITFVFAGWISKRKNGIWSLRLGVAFFAVFFISILLLKDNAIKYAFPLGILFGISAGFYWLAYYVLCFDFTCVGNRDTYNGYDGAIMGAANSIAPLTASYIIYNNASGYTTVFGLSLGLFVILTIVSIFLRSDNYGKSLDFKRIFISRSEEWKKIRKGVAAWGMRDVVIIFLITVLIFKTTGSEWVVGKFYLYAYLVSSASFIIVQRIIKPKRRRFSVHLGAVFMFAAVWGLVVRVSVPSLLLYVLVDAAFMPFFFVPLSSVGFNFINRSHEEDMRIEYIISRELALNTGRMVSAGILIALLIFVKNDRILNYFLILIGSAQVISLYFLRKLDIKVWE